MTRLETLAGRLGLAGGALPEILNDLILEVRHTTVALERDLPAELAEELEGMIEDITPLFAAGFGAAAGQDPSRISIAVAASAKGVTLTVKDAAHTVILPYLLTRAVEDYSQTPPGAYQFLLQVMDGDEEAAREAFSPKDFTADVKAIVLRATGASAPGFRIDVPLMRPGFAKMLASVDTADEDFVFAIAGEAQVSEAVEHGFLSLFGLGVFLPFDRLSDLPEGEPEVFVRNTGQGNELVIDGWVGQPEFLGELLWVVSGGRPDAVRLISAE